MESMHPANSHWLYSGVRSLTMLEMQTVSITLPQHSCHSAQLSLGTPVTQRSCHSAQPHSTVTRRSCHLAQLSLSTLVTQRSCHSAQLSPGTATQHSHSAQLSLGTVVSHLAQLSHSTAVTRCSWTLGKAFNIPPCPSVSHSVPILLTQKSRE